jgi:hypothetical protein
VKKLLVFVLFFGCATYVGAAPQSATDEAPLPDPRASIPGTLEIPKNCQTTLQADGSVLTTCECEQCGQLGARDGVDPLPWACVSRQGAIHCGYDATQEYETGARKKDRI